MPVKQQDISVEVWEQNYRAEGELTVEDTWERQARTAASVEDESIREKVYKDFLWLLTGFKGIAGGRITANLGVAREGTTLMNCFVHNPSDIGFKDVDSIEGIYSMLKSQALTLKSEGGYGMNFSWIRPAGTYINGIGSRTPGVLKFMELWDKSSEIITMGSEVVIGERKKDEKKKIRKGAQMGILSIWHPEIEAFIDAKLTPNRLTKFNLSVGVTEGFMDAVNNDGDWNLEYPVTTHPAYKSEWVGDIYKWKSAGYPTEVFKTVKARDLWDKIMFATYTRNDPGVLFLDLVNKLNPLAYAEDVYTTNPCGEIAMSTGVCNLLSINLTAFCKWSTELNKFDFNMSEFEKAVQIAVRFSDNINDISPAPLPEYTKSMTEKRRIGIGTLGLGSLHYMLGIRFGSPESIKLIDAIYKAKAETELIASANLGAEKGSFSLFDAEKYFNSYWFKNVPIHENVKETVKKIGCMRNSHHAANAPTGNMSIYAGVLSGGIEPVFLKEYVRWSIVPEQVRADLRNDGFKFPDVFKGEWFETEHMKFFKKGSDEILKGSYAGVDYEVDKNRGLVKASLVEDYGWQFAKENFTEEQLIKMEADGVFATTADLTVSDHVNTLKTIAQYINMNSSKTVNVSNTYPYEDFKNLYMNAWKSGIKGITTYRDGTMTAVLEKKQENIQQQNELEKTFLDAADGVILDDVKLPNEYISKGYIIKDNNRKKWYVNIAFADVGCTKPFAMFVHTNSKESHEVTEETIEAMMKLAKDSGIKRQLIGDQLEKYIGQSNVTKIARSIGFLLRHNIKIIDIVDVLDAGNYPLSSFPFHVKRILKQFVKDGTKVSGKNGVCPQCGGHMIFQEGCILCKDCSYSKCS